MSDPSSIPIAGAGGTGQIPLLEMRGLKKSFGGERALAGVDLTIMPGEVHGLLGENGSGKSTLIKVLAGYHAPDAGTMHWHGREVSLPLAPGQFRDLGISFVHQDLGLIASLTALENLKMIDLATGKDAWINWSRERKRADEIFERYGVGIDPDRKVEDLSSTDRARLAIVRALDHISHAEGRGMLVLDEPTVFMPKEGTEELFELVRNIAATHASVLFVSHDIDEVFEVTDRVTVLRDGENHGTAATADVSKSDVVELIIGRALDDTIPTDQPEQDLPISVTVTGLLSDQLSEISFDVHQGEILGVTGLMGSGYESIPYLMFGAQASDAGEMDLGGTRFDLAHMSPRQALKAKIAFLPGNRQDEGSVGTMTVCENITLQTIDRYGRFRMRKQQMQEDARELLHRFDVRPADPEMLFEWLSGGNQQKVLIAKWLQIEPRLLLLHEPTQGVDIGAREQIGALLRRTADSGTSIVCASSDYEQLAQICHRILVVARGRIAGELRHGAVTKDRISNQVYRVTSA